MINDKDFINFINDASHDLSREELEQIIDEELKKSAEEMDADLLEYCLDALNELDAVGEKNDGDVNVKYI